MGVLQDFHAKRPELAIVTIAVDAQGVEHPMRYLRAGKATYEMWIDATLVLSRRWGLKKIPFLALLDENGVVLHQGAHPDAAFFAEVEKFLPKPPAAPPPEPKVDTKNTQIEIFMQSCSNLLTRKRIDDAVAALRKAMALDPENRLIEKQIWALQHPEKFYSGPIDKEWQKGLAK